jgi:hypothetical protein
MCQRIRKIILGLAITVGITCCGGGMDCCEQIHDYMPDCSAQISSE